MKTVCVGMSGGVDSSVAAYLLKQQGYNVFGLFMKNWEETLPDGSCPAEDDFEDVAKVCRQIGIPYYTVDFSKEYYDLVFDEFLVELKQGRTPNPDVLCNREIKFAHFYRKAKELGADLIATGHYARFSDGMLKKGVDQGKDQSYFLYAAPQKALSETLFPLGELEKKEVRKIAQSIGLATCEKKDSVGICFIGKHNFIDFVGKYLPYQKGPICLPDGTVVGTHQGVAFYTIGQRKGLGIGGPGEAYFVSGKDTEKNVLYVAQGANHPALFAKGLCVKEAVWVAEKPILPMRLHAKIRYRQEDQSCIVDEVDGNIVVTFDAPQRAVTVGQSVVWYDGDRCLGGGVIDAPMGALEPLGAPQVASTNLAL